MLPVVTDSLPAALEDSAADAAAAEAARAARAAADEAHGFRIAAQQTYRDHGYPVWAETNAGWYAARNADRAHRAANEAEAWLQAANNTDSVEESEAAAALAEAQVPLAEAARDLARAHATEAAWVGAIANQYADEAIVRLVADAEAAATAARAVANATDAAWRETGTHESGEIGSKASRANEDASITEFFAGKTREQLQEALGTDSAQESAIDLFHATIWHDYAIDYLRQVEDHAADVEAMVAARVARYVADAARTAANAASAIAEANGNPVAIMAAAEADAAATAANTAAMEAETQAVVANNSETASAIITGAAAWPGIVPAATAPAGANWMEIARARYGAMVAAETVAVASNIEAVAASQAARTAAENARANAEAARDLALAKLAEVQALVAPAPVADAPLPDLVIPVESDLERDFEPMDGAFGTGEEVAEKATLVPFGEEGLPFGDNHITGVEDGGNNSPVRDGGEGANAFNYDPRMDDPDEGITFRYDSLLDGGDTITGLDAGDDFHMEFDRDAFVEVTDTNFLAGGDDEESTLEPVVLWYYNEDTATLKYDADGFNHGADAVTIASFKDADGNAHDVDLTAEQLNFINNDDDQTPPDTDTGMG